MKTLTVLMNNKFFKDKTLLISFLVISLGFIIGSIIYFGTDSNIKDTIFSIFVDFCTEYKEKTKIEIFSSLALEGLLYFACMFIFGSSIFGKYILFFISTLKTVGISALISHFYSQYKLEGLEYVLLIFSPGKFIFLFATLIMTKLCVDTSMELTKVQTGTNPLNLSIKSYIIKSLTVLGFFVLSWIVDFVCMTVFTPLFQL